jgi:hypothetical protein
MAIYKFYSLVKFTMIIRLVFFLCIFFVSAPASSTEQIPEDVSIGDGNFQFVGYPLEKLISDEEFRQKFEVEELCSGAWRGYQGHWQISQGVLYLLALIKNPCEFDDKKGLFDLKKLFTSYGTPYSREKANWFSGEIVIPIGELEIDESRKSPSGHFATVHEAIVYTIENGEVLSRVIEKRDR